MKNFKNNMIKETVKEGWTNNNKLAIIGLISGMLAIVTVVAFD